MFPPLKKKSVVLSCTYSSRKKMAPLGEYQSIKKRKKKEKKKEHIISSFILLNIPLVLP